MKALFLVVTASGGPDFMEFFDKAKKLAVQAQESLAKAEGMINAVEGFLPAAQAKKLDDLQKKAEGTLEHLTGKPTPGKTGELQGKVSAPEAKQDA